MIFLRTMPTDYYNDFYSTPTNLGATIVIMIMVYLYFQSKNED